MKKAPGCAVCVCVCVCVCVEEAFKSNNQSQLVCVCPVSSDPDRQGEDLMRPRPETTRSDRRAAAGEKTQARRSRSSR